MTYLRSDTLHFIRVPKLKYSATIYMRQLGMNERGSKTCNNTYKKEALLRGNFIE